LAAEPGKSQHLTRWYAVGSVGQSYIKAIFGKLDQFSLTAALSVGSQAGQQFLSQFGSLARRQPQSLNKYRRSSITLAHN
jgi:hypothetical protein